VVLIIVFIEFSSFQIPRFPSSVGATRMNFGRVEISVTDELCRCSRRFRSI